jgi:DNA-binding XRE family transcriptional regulator
MTASELREMRVSQLLMTQEDLARTLGCSSRTIIRAENGHTQISEILALALQTVRPNSKAKSRDLGPWQERRKPKKELSK